MNLYTVTLRMDVAVVAASPGEAERIAEDSVKFARDLSELHGTANATFSMPDGWDEMCVPFGSTKPRTLREWLAKAGSK